jgi:ribosomal protein L14E/L6E/L27E
MHCICSVNNVYSKRIEVRYFPGTKEAAVIVDGVHSRTFSSVLAALKEAGAEFTREVIRRERTDNDSDASR